MTDVTWDVKNGDEKIFQKVWCKQLKYKSPSTDIRKVVEEAGVGGKLKVDSWILGWDDY